MKQLLKQILILTHLWNIIVKVRVFKVRKIDYRINRKRLESISSQINEMVNRISERKPESVVYIFQHSYYSTDGKQYISGGGERYATDLGVIIHNLDFCPILIQLGNDSDKEPWEKKHGALNVIGANVKLTLFNDVIAGLSKPRLAIYSGYVDFGEELFHPNIMISHGVTWDNPLIDVDSRKIMDILKPIDRLVSVDTNTISWLRSTFANYLSTQSKNMHYIPNYVDLERYHTETNKNSGNIKIIFPRRLSPERGFWLIEKALPKILDTYPYVHFDFIGFIHTKDIESALKRLMTKYSDRINHYFVDSDKMYEVYQNADITLIPTLYSEGTSLSCIEAMACGNLVIATNIGGLPNLIINDYNGMLINPDEGELLNAIDKAVSDASYRKRLGDNACKVAQEFSKGKWNDRWEKLLLKCLT